MTPLSRRQRILVLAWSLDLLMPSPPTATGQLTAGQQRRPAPSAWAWCAPCSGTGHTTDRYGRGDLCRTCRGAGRYRVDEYTLEQINAADSAQTAPSNREWVGCPWCQSSPASLAEAHKTHTKLPPGTGVRAGVRCDRCDGTGRRWITRDPDPIAAVDSDDLDLLDPRARRILRQLATRRRQGSYHELEQALATLRDLDRRAFRVFVDEHVLQTAGDRDPLELAYAEATVDGLMPARVRVPAEVAEAWLRVQDGKTLEERARVLARRGVGLRAIAVAQGVSVWQVRKALGRHTIGGTA